METKHTPGPWLIMDQSFVYALNERGTNIFWAHAYGGWKGRNADERTSDEEVEANAKLMAAAPVLLKALQWALPLARMAMEAHRMDRLRCGHNDIVGKYKSGQAWAGIYQSEVDEIEFACAAITKATE